MSSRRFRGHLSGTKDVLVCFLLLTVCFNSDLAYAQHGNSSVNESMAADDIVHQGVNDRAAAAGCQIYKIIVMNDFNEQMVERIKGWLVASNKRTKLLLIGNENLSSLDLVTFTARSGLPGTRCSPFRTHNNSFSIKVLSRSNGVTIAQVDISLPSLDPNSWSRKLLGEFDTYHLCYKHMDHGHFVHPIGLLDHTKILVFEELLPTWMKIFFSIIGFIMSFYLSGLVLGIMAIDITDLMLLNKSGTPKQKIHAQQLLPIRKNGNRILCTLLFSNVAANSLVTVFLNNLIDSGWQTFIVSTVTLCLIGEIIPQAVFNRHGFILAAKSILFIKFLLYITAPFAIPIGIILDKILGAEAGMAYTRKQMRQLIELQYESGNLKLHETEMHILQSALAMQKTQVQSLMIRISKVFMISQDSHLDFANISAIMSSGFTRIPVFRNERTNIVGIINVKDLALINPDDNMSLDTFCSCYKTEILLVPQDLSIIKLLQEFIKGKSHLAFVYRQTSSVHNQNENEIEGSDKEDRTRSDKKSSVRRKRTTSNLSASLRLEYFLCNGSNQKNNRSMDDLNKIGENDDFLKAPKPVIDDSGIFLVSGREELSDTCAQALQHIIGIITLEDIFELILQEKIFDEKDLDPSTLKSSQKDFTILTKNTGQKLPIYEKTLYATYQFLSSKILPFHCKFLSASILNNLLRNNIHQFTPTVDNFELKLYRQNIRATYFTLILSGAGEVVIGKENMKFPAQHFSYFGVQAILVIIKIGDNEIRKDTVHIEHTKEVKFIPDFTLTLKEKCIYIMISRHSYLEAVKSSREKKSAEAVNSLNENYRAKILNVSGLHKMKRTTNTNPNETRKNLTNDRRFLTSEDHNEDTHRFNSSE